MAVCCLFCFISGWFCKICRQHGEGVLWVSKAVNFGEHPRKYLERHQNSKTHKAAIKQKHIFQRMNVKHSIYKQIITGAGNSYQNVVQRNRRVIKKFMNTVYSFAQIRFVIRENFENVVDFLMDLGDVDIQEHLHQSSCLVTYISKTTTNEYLTCISDHVEDGLLSRLIATADFSILADKTTISDRAELANFVKYINNDSHHVKEEFLGFAQIKGNKGAAQICEKNHQNFF